jgi:hypothetical protein
LVDILEQIVPFMKIKLLIIDQAEDLLRGSPRGFLHTLRVLLSESGGRLVLLATVRSDYLHVLQASMLITTEPLLRYPSFTVEPLPRSKLGDIILLAVKTALQQRFVQKGVAIESAS